MSEDKIPCRVCGRLFHVISPAHLKKHGLTCEEYKRRYPDAEFFSPTYRKVKGEQFKKGRKTKTEVKKLTQPKTEKPKTEKSLFWRDDIKHIYPSDWSQFIPDGLEKYVPQSTELEDAMAILESGRPLLLVGIKGIGKSLLARTIAKKWGIPCFTVNCSLGTSEDDFTGYFVNLGTFADGIVTQAVRCAMETGKAMIVFEEVNGLQPGVAISLHPLFDFNKTLTIKATGETIPINNGARLYIVATANMGYEGTLPMNPAFKSRFTQIPMFMPPKRTLLKIAKNTGVPDEVAEAMMNIVLGLQQASQRAEIRDYPSIREMVTACKLYLALGDFSKAVKYAFLSEFLHSKTETELVKNIIQSSSTIEIDWRRILPR